MKFERLSARPLGSVPRGIVAFFVLALALQVVSATHRQSDPREGTKLPAPPSVSTARLLSFDEPLAAAQALILRLATADQPAGRSLSYHELDYGRIESWLARSLDLDPIAATPLLLAGQVYGQVDDPVRVRRMLDFVQRRFREDPDRRWRHMAHAVVAARHRLGDAALARAYAEDLARLTTPGRVPGWARQMHALIAADFGETETAKVLLGGILAETPDLDPAERRFLLSRIGPPGGGNSAPTSENHHR